LILVHPWRPLACCQHPAVVRTLCSFSSIGSISPRAASSGSALRGG